MVCSRNQLMYLPPNCEELTYSLQLSVLMFFCFQTLSQIPYTSYQTIRFMLTSPPNLVTTSLPPSRCIWKETHINGLIETAHKLPHKFRQTCTLEIWIRIRITAYIAMGTRSLRNDCTARIEQTRIDLHNSIDQIERPEGSGCQRQRSPVSLSTGRGSLLWRLWI